VSPTDVYSALWRHKLAIVALTAIFVAMTVVVTKRETKTYTAASLVRVQQRIQNAGEAFSALQTGGRLAQTYAKITTTTTIARKIYDDLEGKVPYRDIDVSARQIDDLELLELSATSASPASAQLVANSAPVALRNFIAETGTTHDQVITVQPARLPTSPSSPNLRMNVMLALVLGLIFNGALALLLEVVSNRIPRPDELERATGAPVLSVVPNLSFAPRAAGGARIARDLARRSERASDEVHR
jgi:capsular polysaccharide biosynthesis protein